MNLAIFWIGLLHGVLMNNYKHWKKSIRWSLRFLLLGIFSSQIYFIGLLLTKPSLESWNSLLDQLFEPWAIFSAAFCIFMGLVMLGYIITSAHLMNSLIENPAT